MKCKEIMDRLEGRIPPAYAEEWDNVGLLAGSPDREVHKIYVSLDASDRAVEEAVRLRADMLVTHHPLLFSPVKRVTDEDFVGRRRYISWTIFPKQHFISVALLNQIKMAN